MVDNNDLIKDELGSVEPENIEKEVTNIMEEDEVINLKKKAEDIEVVSENIESMQTADVPIMNDSAPQYIPQIENPHIIGFTPLEPKKKVKEPEEPIVVVQKQNKILKWVCVGLAACTALSLSLSLYGVFKPTNSNILVSDLGTNRIATTVVAGSNEPFSASQIYAENLDSVVTIQTEIVQSNFFQQIVGQAAGSGFFISEDGYVLTNYHVVENGRKITVTLSNGKSYEARLVGSEEENDIAVLKIDSEDVFKPVVLGDSDKMIVGEDVVAIGNPLGELTFSITKGIVSAIDRQIQVDNFNTINMFQVDCAVNEGNSGGPIFNMYGEVVGVVSAKYASETIEGLGFCIPINDVQNIVSDLIEHGQVMNKAYMGIQVTDVDSTMINQYNMVAGAYVAVVDEGSCAQKAGLKIGDIIVEFDGKKIEAVSDLLSAKRSFRAGDTAEFKIWRSGEYTDLKITFDEYIAEKENTQVDGDKNFQQQLEEYYNQYNQYNQHQQNPYNEYSFEDFLNEFVFGY